MQIYKHAQGVHLSIHSFNATPPSLRRVPAPAPSALVLVCHGIFEASTLPIPVAPHTAARFVVKHGKPAEIGDYKWFQALVTDGLQSALEFDFKRFEATRFVMNNARLAARIAAELTAPGR